MNELHEAAALWAVQTIKSANGGDRPRSRCEWEIVYRHFGMRYVPCPLAVIGEAQAWIGAADAYALIPEDDWFSVDTQRRLWHELAESIFLMDDHTPDNFTGQPLYPHEVALLAEEMGTDGYLPSEHELTRLPYPPSRLMVGGETFEIRRTK